VTEKVTEKVTETLMVTQMMTVAQAAAASTVTITAAPAAAGMMTVTVTESVCPSPGFESNSFLIINSNAQILSPHPLLCRLTLLLQHRPLQ
jgi:hypothetical protein